ncbi:MAG: DUF58 domain-containing protein [Rhodocyclaceae bacterium]|nr:DUF58 domain-containing protein [Rhodocyclaceae bacterium]MBX3669942.1 DUF58 domain-containing protein [Rhodocyclaceae bacterium]
MKPAPVSRLPVPHRNLLRVLGLWFALGVAAIIFDPLLPLWQAAGLSLAGLALGDYATALLRGNPLTLERQLSRTWPVGSWQGVSLRLTLSGRGRLAGRLHDAHPPAFAVEAQPADFHLHAGEALQLTYRLLATERGLHRFGTVALRLNSPFGLWQMRAEAGAPDSVRVYPDFARVRRYSLLATDNRLSQMGMLLRRRRGEGMEFRQLRDYRRDDSPRSVDWKATARAGKLIAREYQDERDQQIVLMLDCGVRMRSKDATLSHFDHALNAALLLAYVGLRQGDAVGLVSFGLEQPRYLPPRKSAGALNTLMNASYDLQPSTRVPDYLVAAQFAATRLTRRALIVLLTNLRDEDEGTLLPALQLLRRRHEVSLANLREPWLEELTAQAPRDFDAALSYAAAQDYAAARARQIARLAAAGVHVVDTTPAKLPAALVNQYWELKRAGIV